MTEPAAKRIKSLPFPSPTIPTSSSNPTRQLSIVTWNCNGFISRSLYNTVELKRLVRDTGEPDVFLFQEVRLKAHSATQRGKPMASELEIVKPTLSTIFGNYIPYWSLSDSRYAGTLTLLHKRLGFHNGTCEATAGATATTTKMTTAFTPSSAIELLLKTYHVTRRDVGLPEQQTSLPKKKAVVQTSMTSFFSSKKASTTTAAAPVTQEHNCEGRFQFFLFQDMDLIQTYVPNNGTKEESFQRRQCWDQEMMDFLQARARILDHVGNGHQHRTLLWCGDMNCARDYRDGTHWVESERNDKDGSITAPNNYEWWTDESQCFVQPPKPQLKRTADDRGMPSFTPGERRRFEALLQTGNLVDVWRDLHPNGSTNRDDLAKWDRPDWTWRGHLGKNGNKSKYEGRGQRLDYFLLSPYSRVAVERCEILGYGAQREGLFCGSDHCASLLVMNTTWNRTTTTGE